MLGPYIIEEVLPNNNYLVRKIGTYKTQVLHRKRIRQFTHRLAIPDIRITPQEWTLDPEVNLKHDYLYARAWECEYEKPIFDTEKKKATPPSSTEFPIQSNLPTGEMRNTPGTARKCSPETFPQTEQMCDATDTYPDVEPDVETTSGQPNNGPTNPRSSKYNLRHNPELNCNDDYK